MNFNHNIEYNYTFENQKIDIDFEYNNFITKDDYDNEIESVSTVSIESTETEYDNSYKIISTNDLIVNGTQLNDIYNNDELLFSMNDDIYNIGLIEDLDVKNNGFINDNGLKVRVRDELILNLTNDDVWLCDIKIPNDAKIFINENNGVIRCNKIIIKNKKRCNEYIIERFRNILNEVILGYLDDYEIISFFINIPFFCLERNEIDDMIEDLLNYNIDMINIIPKDTITLRIKKIIAEKHYEPLKILLKIDDIDIAKILIKRNIIADRLYCEIDEELSELLIDLNTLNYEKIPEKYKNIENTKKYVSDYPKRINNIPNKFIKNKEIAGLMIENDASMILTIFNMSNILITDVSLIIYLMNINYKIIFYFKDGRITKYLLNYLTHKMIKKNQITNLIKTIEIFISTNSTSIPSYAYEFIIKHKPLNIKNIHDKNLTYGIVKLALEKNVLGHILMREENSTLSKIISNNINEFIKIKPLLIVALSKIKKLKSLITKEVILNVINEDNTITTKMNISNIPDLFTLENKIEYCKAGVPFGLILFRERELLNNDIIIDLIKSRKDMINEISYKLLDEKMVAFALNYHKIPIESINENRYNIKKIFLNEIELYKKENENSFEMIKNEDEYYDDIIFEKLINDEIDINDIDNTILEDINY